MSGIEWPAWPPFFIWSSIAIICRRCSACSVTGSARNLSMPRDTLMAPLTLRPAAYSDASRTSTKRASPRVIVLRRSSTLIRDTAVFAAANISFTLDGMAASFSGVSSPACSSRDNTWRNLGRSPRRLASQSALLSTDERTCQFPQTMEEAGMRLRRRRR